MLAVDLDLLLDARGWPAVSILCPADRSEWPGLLIQAKERLGEIVDDTCTDGLLAALGRAADDLDVEDWPAIGVFAHPRFVHAVALPQPVRPRVVVDSTFATRDLVAGLARTPRYLVLVIDGDGARLWAGLGRRLAPAPGVTGFPLVFPEQPNPTERRHRQERSHRRDAHLDRCHRMVDETLGSALRAGDRRPLFVVGRERRVHRYAATSALGDRLAAVIAADPDSSASTLADLVAEHLEEDRATRSAAAIETIGASIGTNRFAAGAAELWPLAHEGRVALLAVEDEYHQHAVLDPDTGVLVPSEEPMPGGVDDAADEIIEAVLAAGGQVETVRSGTLSEWDRIAASLRH